MLTTPEDARYLWCPMVRMARHEVVTVEGAPVGNMAPVYEQHHVVAGCNTDALGGLRVPASCRCIADKCAMWRWSPSTTTHTERKVVAKKGGPGSPTAPTWTEVGVDVPDAPTHGFCGIAGRPEALP